MISSPAQTIFLFLNAVSHLDSEAIKTGIAFMKETLASRHYSV